MKTTRGIFASAAAALALTGLVASSSFNSTALAGDTPATNSAPKIVLTTTPANNNTNNVAVHKPTILSQAGDYSQSKNSIGIAIMRGKNSPYSAQQVGDKLVQMLQANGASGAKYFSEDPSEAQETRVVFFIQNEADGPYSLNGSLRQAKTVANTYLGLKAKAGKTAAVTQTSDPTLALK